MHVVIQGKRWDELSTSQRVMVLASAALQLLVGAAKLAVLLAALADLRRRPSDEIRGSKRLWRFVVFLHWLGPVAYFLVGRKPTEAE
jgi:hypothetical protein